MKALERGFVRITCNLSQYCIIVCILTVSVDGAINATNAKVYKPTENANLWCISDAQPQPRKIKWYKDGHELHTEKDHYEIKHHTENLLVIQAGEEDVGTYTCKDNATGDTADLKLNAVPWSVDGSEVEVKEGENITIDCHAWGYPVPEVKWYFNGHEIKPDGSRIIFEDKPTKQKKLVLKNGTLKLKGATLSDAGSYKCHASNTYGSHDASTNARVREKLEALWPAIGIALELGVIGGGIGYYEYNKKKKNDKEKKMDQDFKERNDIEVRRHQELQVRDQL